MYSFSDALKCYIDSEGDIKVAQNLYAFRYPARPQLELKTLDIIQCYFDSEQDLKITENLYAFRYPTQPKLDQETLRKMFNDKTSTKTISSENLESINQPGTSMSNINNILQNFQCKESLFPYNSDLPIKKEIIMQDSDDEKDIRLPALTCDEIQFFNVNKEVLPPIEELVSHIKVEINEENAKSIRENDVVVMERKRRKSLDDLNFQSTTKKNKSDTQDAPINILDEKIFNSIPIIYTKRLDDMCIFQINLSAIPPKYIFDTILNESKPSYMNSSYHMMGNLLINRKIRLNKIYNTLNMINNKSQRKLGTCKRQCKRKNKLNKTKKENKEEIKTDTMIFDRLNNKSLLIDLTDDNDQNNKSSAIHSNKGTTKSIKLKYNLNKPDLKGSNVVVPKVQRKMRDAIVYTTRLNNMAILQKKVKFFNVKYILNEILRESKPLYKYYPQQNIERGINYETLKYKLHLMNNKNRKKFDDVTNVEKIINAQSFITLKLTNVRYQISTDELNYKLIFVGTQIRNEINEEDEYVTKKYITKHYVRNPKLTEIIDVDKNIACVIHNKWSKITEIYITDSCGKIIEHSKMKLLNNKNLDSNAEFNDPEKIDSSKKIIKFHTCCWFNRKKNIEEVWLNSNMEIVRFMRTIHHCPVENCVCCCKPGLLSKPFRISKDLLITPHTKFTRRKKQLNLISRALEYRKPMNKQTDVQYSKLDKTIDTNNSLIQITRKGQINNPNDTVNYYAIDSKGRVNFIANFSEENTDSEFIRNRFTSKTELCYKSYIICCKITQDRLTSDLKKKCLPPHTIKYLQGPTISTICNECRNTIKHRGKNIKLIIDSPIVEHTRKFSVATLIKSIYHPKTKRSAPKEWKSRTDVSPSTINPPNQNSPHLNHPPQLNLESNTITLSTEIPKNSQCLTLKSMQYPEIETVIKEVDTSIAASLKEQLKNMNFCYQNGKLVASLKFIIATTSQEFESLAKLLQITESKLKKINVPSGTCLNFYVEYKPMPNNNKFIKTIPNRNDFENKFDFITKSLSSDKISYRKSFSSYIKTKHNYVYNTPSEIEKIVMPVISNVFSLNENSSSKSDSSLKNYYLVGKDGLKSNNQATFTTPCTSKSETDDLFVLHLTSNNIIETTVESILKDKGNKPVQEDKDTDQFESQIPMNVIVDYKSVSNGYLNNGNPSNMPDLISDLLKTDNVVKNDSNKYLKHLLEAKTTNFCTKHLNFNK